MKTFILLCALACPVILFLIYCRLSYRYDDVQNFIKHNIVSDGWEDDDGFHYGKRITDDEVEARR